MPNLAACPRFVPRKDDPDGKKDSLAEAAEEGTFLHGKMEALAEVPVEKWDAAVADDAELDEYQRAFVTDAAAQVRDLFGLGLPVVTKRSLKLKPEDHYRLTGNDLVYIRDDMDIRSFSLSQKGCVYCEVSVDPGVCAPGTADLFVKFGNKGVLVDYKTVRVNRSHDLQMKSYVVGFFDATDVEFIEVRIVAPRLREAHAYVTYSRTEDLARLRAELEAVVARAEDPFTPGCPGDQCAMCDGNGRCPWQAATLRDIPVDEGALVLPDAWKPVLSAATPELRGQRRGLVKWLEAFVASVKDDDKAWALANPDKDVPGFTKSVSPGRPSLDRDHLQEANVNLLLALGLTDRQLLAFCVPDKNRLAEHAGVLLGLPTDEAKRKINAALSPYMKRGEDIVSFRAVKKKKEIANV